MTDCYKTMRLDDLVEDPHNARLHDMPNLTAIRASLLRFGQVEPLVVQSGTNQVVGGNGRLRVMRALGWETAEVREVDLDDKEAIALGLALNRTAELATWDETMLRTHLKTLSEAEFDIGGFALNEEDLKSIKFDVDEPTAVEGNTDPDDVPEPPEDPITKPGDLWILGNHRLFCGDSTKPQHVERLMDGQKADMVFTDPPYNIASENKGIAAHVSKAHSNLMNADWDKGFNFADVQGCLLAAIAENATVYVCTSHHLAGSIWQWMNTWSDLSNWCVWSKPNPMPSLMKRHWTWSGELICYGTRGKHVFNFPGEGHAFSIWTIAKVNGSSGHPTEKPVSVSEHAVLHSSKKDQLVLDLFGGSGSTLIACEKTNRHCRMMELDPAYCDVIVKRWEDFTGQKAVRA